MRDAIKILLASLAILIFLQSGGAEERDLKESPGAANPKAAKEAIGTAKMLDDESIYVRMRAVTGSAMGEIAYKIQKGDPRYDRMILRVGGLAPGEEKSIPSTK